MTNSPAATVSSSSVLDLLDSCDALGVVHNESPKLIRDTLLNPEDRIDEGLVIALWKEIALNTRIPHIGLCLGQRINPSAKGLLASWVSQCETLAEAFNVFHQHILLMNPSEHWTLHTTRKFTELSFTLAEETDYPNAAIERSMSALVTWGKALTGQNIKPHCSRFSYKAPEYIDQYQTIFGANLEFSADRNSLIFDTHLLDLPIKSANPYLKQMIQLKASDALGSIRQETVLGNKVKQLIQDSLSSQQAGIDHLSQALGMSRQTLYRHLKSEGTDFKTLLNEVRKTRALELLNVNQTNMLHISLSLGFKETSSFNKAFHRWYGMSPSEYLSAKHK